MLGAADLHAHAALARKIFRRLRIFEQMEPVVLFAAVRLTFARALAREERGGAIPRNSGWPYFGALERLATQALDRISTQRFQRTERETG
jgi:hypothetical protein